MPDPVEDYQNALREYDQARKNIQELAQFVRQAGSALQHWEVVIVSGIDARWPMELMTPASPRIDGKRWPTAEQLATALQNFHKTREAARTAFQNIPEDRRHGLVEPPKR